MLRSVLACCSLFTIFISIGAAFAQDQSASAPSCLVGQKLEFRYDNGGSFSRVIAAREGDLCVVNSATKSYYDKDWVLVKVVEPDGRTITSASPTHSDIGEKWLPFPLALGKKWEYQRRGAPAERGAITIYQNQFNVLANEEITVPAGTFKTFKIKHDQQNFRSGTQRWGSRYFWYAPELGYYVKRYWAVNESVDKYFWQTVRDYELVSVTHPK